MANDPMFTATDEDRKYVAKRIWEFRKLVQQTADKAKLKDAKRHSEEKPEWLRSRPRGRQCQSGEAIRAKLEKEGLDMGSLETKEEG